MTDDFKYPWQKHRKGPPPADGTMYVKLGDKIVRVRDPLGSLRVNDPIDDPDAYGDRKKAD